MANDKGDGEDSSMEEGSSREERNARNAGGNFAGVSDDPAGELASCHTEALRVADELGARTIAFPAISTGAFGYPLEEAAAVAVRAVRGADTRVEEVRFVLLGREAFEAFERALAR